MLERLNRPERLDFLAMKFGCRAVTDFCLENAYSDLHGGFGLMLHTHFPLVYRDLFGEQQDSGMVRVYVLRPAPSLQGSIMANDMFSFELILFGAATRHASACAEALGQLGINGITRNRYKFGVERIERIAPEDISIIWSTEGGWNVRHLTPTSAVELLNRPFTAELWQLQFVSPAAIKSDNNLLRDGLSPLIFFERLLGRAQLLATQQAGGPLLDNETKQCLIDSAKHIRVVRDDTRWIAQTRYSVRQQQRSEFGGLMGNLLLRGQSELLQGWLNLAPWMHVGSKTSFGLGQCKFLSAN